MPEGFKAGAAFVDVDADADVAIRKIERQLKAASGRLNTAAARIGSNMGASIGSNLERQLKASKGRLGVAADGIGTHITGRLNTAISRGLGGRLDTSISRRASEVGEAVGSALGDGVDEGAARSLGRNGGPRTRSALDSISERSQAQFKGMVFAGAFGGLPIAAAAASALTIGALAAIPIAAVAGAAKLQASNEQVEASYIRLGDTTMGVLKRSSSVLSDELITGTDKLTDKMARLEPVLTGVFRNSAPAVDGVVEAVTTLADEALPGVVTASTKTGAAMTGLVAISKGAGRGVSDFFVNVSAGAESSAKNGAILGRVIQDLLGFAGRLTSNLASNTGALNSFANGMSTVYATVDKVTQSGGALTGFVSGFTTVVSGALGVVNALSSGLGGVVAPLLAMAGAFKAVDMLTGGKLVGNLASQFEGLGGRIKEADGARGKFQAGFSGIAEAAFSPAGLAVAGLTVGLGLLGMAQQRAAQAAADHRARVADLAAALRESNGSINENVRASAAKSLADTKLADSGKSFLGTARALGVSLPQLTDAYLGNDVAGRRIVETIKAQIAEGEKYASSRGEADALQEKKALAGEFIGTMTDLNGAYGQAVQANKDLAAASGNTAQAMGAMSPTLAAVRQGAGEAAAAYATLYTPMASVADKGNAMIAILDRLAGRTPSWEESVQTMNDTIRGLSDALSKGMDTSKGWGMELVRADGTVNTLSENGTNLQNSLVALQGGFANTAVSINELVKGGMTYQSASAKVREDLQLSRDRFVDIATVMLGNRDAANALADTYGLMPDAAITKVTDLGTAVITQTDVLNLQSKLKALPPNTPVRITSITAEAEQKLKDLNYTVTHMEDGSVLVTANTAGAIKDVDVVESRVQSIKDRTVNVSVVTRYSTIGNPAPVAGGRSALMDDYATGGPSRTPWKPRARATGGPTPALPGLAGARRTGERGPEIDFPSRSSYVATALQTSRIDRGVAKITDAAAAFVPAQRSSPDPVAPVTININVTAPPSMDMDALATKISRVLERRMKGGR